MLLFRALSSQSQSCPAPYLGARLSCSPLMFTSYPAQAFIIGQQLPGERVIIIPDAQEPPEAHYRVRHPAAALIDHNAFNRAYLVAVRAVYVRPLYLVACDQR